MNESVSPDSGVVFVDTTLREGAQSPGVFFDQPTKIAFVSTLSALGVGEIEIGAPCLGAEEEDDLRTLIHLPVAARLFTWNRALEEDVDSSLRLGVQKVHISLPVSDQHIHSVLRKSRSWIRDRLVRLVTYARREGLEVQVGFEDGSRTDEVFLKEMAGEAKNSGVERIRFCDTVGRMDPVSVGHQIGALREVGLPIEIHCHNDLGMATANTISGYQAGARFLSTTVSGVGERAGNASMEEVAFALEYSLRKSTGIQLTRLAAMGRWIHQVMGRALSPYRPILGSRVFHHASGIHVDGVLKDAENYESYPPEIAGLKRKIHVTHMTGRSGVRNVLERMGYAPSPEMLEKLWPIVRREGISRRGIVPPQVILEIFLRLLDERSGIPPTLFRQSIVRGTEP
ncbi:MAG: homocitrate synthase/isopropylmalate synthase family protein [Leptospirales bacterium]